VNYAVLAGEVWSSTGVERNRLILISAGRFNVIGAIGEVDIPDGHQVLDYRSRFVTAGLVDAHLHLSMSGGPTDEEVRREDSHLTVLRCVRNARRNLEAGITSVRELGAKGVLGATIRRAVAEGLVTGPRIKVAGRPITTVGGYARYMAVEARGPAAVRRAVDEQLSSGVDWIKVFATTGILGADPGFGVPQMAAEEIRAAVEAAHAAGVKVAAHANGEPGIRICVESGVDSIEHGIGLTSDLARAMAERGTWYVPTLSAYHLIANDAHGAAHGPHVMAKARQAVEVHRASFRMALEAGVRVATGTDYRHCSIWLEGELMVRHGALPRAALHAATEAGSQLLGVDGEVGSIAPGKSADLVVFDGNPLQDLAALQRVRLVMHNGEIVGSNSSDDPIDAGGHGLHDPET
jgi:imidazolonepropionase-like amidohydrolase